MAVHYYRQFGRKIILTLTFFSVVPVLFLGYLIYRQFEDSYNTKIIENLKTIASSRRQTIDLFLEERLSQLITLAYSNTYENMINPKYLENLLNFIQRGIKYFVDIGVIDEYGNHVAYYGPYKLHNINYREEEWFKKVMVQGTYISDVFLGFRGIPHFIIAVLRYEGQKIWILRATIDSNIFEKLVRAAFVGKTGNAYVVNSDGILQTKPRFDQNVLEKKNGLHMEEISQGETSIKEIKESQQYVVATKLETKDWYFVLEQNPQKELEPIFKTRKLASVLAAVGILFVISGILFVSRQMVKELEKMEREKAQMDANLVQSSKLAALGKLAAGVAHEINNPLSVILEKAGWIRDLLEEEDLKKSQNFQELEKAVQKIEEHVERARKVTHSLLGFARRMEPVNEPVDVVKLIEDTLSFLEVETKFKGVSLHRDYAQDLPIIRSDSSQLQQVFLNILENAVDAIPEGGNIWVRVVPDKNGHVVVEVADDGPGIPDNHKKKIFDPFFTTKPVGNGTGLGLSISYNIVKRFGGEILVSDNTPKGTVFKVLLPINRPEI